MTRRLPLAVCALALLAGFSHAAVSTAVPAACHTVDVGDDSQATWQLAQELLDAGYVGDPTDGADRLYSPACFDPASTAAQR